MLTGATAETAQTPPLVVYTVAQSPSTVNVVQTPPVVLFAVVD
jgi:hypothetical protein